MDGWHNFTTKFNGISLRPSIPRPNGNLANQLKFVDDSAKAASINSKNSCLPDPSTKPIPRHYHERIQMMINPEDNLKLIASTKKQLKTTLSQIKRKPLL